MGESFGVLEWAYIQGLVAWFQLFVLKVGFVNCVCWICRWESGSQGLGHGLVPVIGSAVKELPGVRLGGSVGCVCGEPPCLGFVTGVCCSCRCMAGAHTLRWGSLCKVISAGHPLEPCRLGFDWQPRWNLCRSPRVNSQPARAASLPELRSRLPWPAKPQKAACWWCSLRSGISYQCLSHLQVAWLGE